MATTQKEHNGNGTQRRFDFDFPYIKEDDVKVSLRTNTADLTDIPSTEYTFPSATEIQFSAVTETDFQESTGAPKTGVTVRVFRDTDLTTERVTFFPGSSIRAQDLNENTLQLLYSNQERQSRAIDSIGGTMIGNLVLNGADIVFEGTSEDNFETVLKVTNPTADQTYRLPNHAAGTYDVITSGDTGTVVTGLIADDAVTMDKLSNSDVTETGTTPAVTQANWLDNTVKDAQIATIGAVAQRHDVIISTTGVDPTPAEGLVAGKLLYNDVASQTNSFKVFDGTAWRVMAQGEPYEPNTTTIVRYVDAINGRDFHNNGDANDGFVPNTPMQTIKHALDRVNASATGDGTLIKVTSGVYQEELPLRIAKNNVSIVGESMRSCFVHPTVSTENNDMFEVDSGSYIANLTLLGLKVPTANQGSRNNTLDNDATHGLPTNQPFAVRFRTDVAPTILKSPYVQNCTHFSDAHFDNANFDPNTFPSTDAQTFSAVAGDESSAPCGGGLLVDGNAVSSSSPIRSMVVDAFTQICLDGPGILVTNNGYAQLVSFFGTFCHYHAKARNGGQINLSNCVSDFGRFGLIADGKSPSPIATATATAANAGATTITVGSITTASSFHGTVTQPLDHMMVTIDGVDYGVVSSTANGSGWDIVLTTGLTSNITNTTVSFALRSYISTGGHTFEFVGVGTDYGDHPDKGGVPVEAKQVVELNGGKVWQSSTDHVGKFKAGDVLVVDQVSETVALKDTTVTGDLAVTGTVDGRDVATDGNTLDALNTNAVLDTDTTTANMQFVVDEDNMASNLDTKVPTQQSVKAYVDTEIADLVASAPAALDTLNELAAALNDDANFSTTVTNSIATKLNASAVSAYGATLVDDADAATARTTLGLGTAAVAATSDFATAAQGTTADNALAASAVSTFGGTLIDDANAATARTTLGLGTAAVAATSDFATAAQGTLADNALPASDVSTFGGTLIDDADAAAARTTLGLGTAATSATSDFATAAQGTKADSAIQPADLSTVATSGSYNDLSNTPTIPTNNNQLTNGAGFITADATKLPLAGGTMAGDIAMGSNKITGLGTPSAAGDATTKQYVDAQISASGSGTVTSVSGNSPISVTNGTSTPAISISAATTSAAGTMSSTDKTKLDGIETGATADQTAAEIKTAYESNADTNAFTNAEQTKLSGIAAGAEVNVQSDWNATSGDAFIDNKPTIPSGDLVDDNAPELSADLDVKGNTIIDTSNTNANIKLAPNGEGVVEIRGNNSGTNGQVAKLQLNCHTNAHGVILASPPHSAGASYTLTLPPDAGSNNQVLKTDGSGTTSWVDQTTAYTDSSVDSHLNQSTAGNGEVLSWNTSTSDYEWVAQSSGGGGSTSPGGSNTQVQFNSSGSFAGSANLTFDGTNLTVGGTLTAVSPTGGAGGHRKIHTSTSSPTSSDGADGDIWIKYT